MGKFLGEAREVLGDRQAAVCLELTKQFQRTLRGTLSQLAQRFQEAPPKGEAVIVIRGCSPREKEAPEGEDA